MMGGWIDGAIGSNGGSPSVVEPASQQPHRESESSQLLLTDVKVEEEEFTAVMQTWHDT